MTTLTEAIASVEAAPYRPTAVRVFIRDYANPSPELPQTPIDWPLPTSLATAGAPLGDPQIEGVRCLVATGDDLDRLWPLFGKANAITPFVSEGTEYAISLRLLLPDEEPICP